MRTRVLAPILALVLAATGPPAQDGPAEPSAEEARLVEEASQAAASEIRNEEAALDERLRSILAAVDDFRGMRAEVQAGIVVLSGRAPSKDAVERATRMAEKLEGVLLVVDDVRVERRLGRRLADTWGDLLKQARGLVAGLPLAGAALLVVILSWLLARFLRDARFLYRFASRRELLQNLLRQTVFVAVCLAGVVAALRFLEAGAVIGTILGAAGVAGIALGFAFRNVIENYLAGVLLAIRQPFRARDLVRIDGSEGTVLRMTASETILMDADGNHVRLPNAMVFNGRVTNYTRNPLRRFQVLVGLGTEVDLERAQALAVATLGRMKGVLDDPDPSSRVAALGDSTVQLEVFGWVDQRSASFLKVESEAHRLVKEAFDDAGIEMPAPGYRVDLGAARADVGAPLPGGKPKAPPAERGPAPEQIDVTPEDDVSRQVDAEIAATRDEDLLGKA